MDRLDDRVTRPEPSGAAVAVQLALILVMAAGIGWTLILGLLLLIGLGPFAGYGIAHHRWQFIVSIGVAVVAGIGLTIARIVRRR